MAGDPCCVESVEGDCEPRNVEKPDGRLIPLARLCVIKALSGTAIVLDRDPNEVANAKGGRAHASAVSCPINVDGQAQAKRPTTRDEFVSKLAATNVPSKGTVIVHCEPAILPPELRKPKAPVYTAAENAQARAEDALPRPSSS
jgi:hypothetical protein